MLKKTLVLFLSSFALQSLSAGEPFMFVKRVENNIDRCNLENILPDGSVEVLYNLGSKSDLERLFSTVSMRRWNFSSGRIPA